MDEKRYEVYSDSVLLASNMTLDAACILIKGYANEYFNKRLILTIKEMEQSTCIEETPIFLQKRLNIPAKGESK